MGALTSYRKRGGDHFTLNSNFPVLSSPDFDRSSDSHTSKRAKFSSSTQPSSDKPGSLRNTASKVSQYPEPINPIRREVHAPCRAFRFGFAASLRRGSKPSTSRFRQKEEISTDVKGDIIGSQYVTAKTSTLDASENSSIEVVEIRDDGCHGGSVVLDQSPMETDRVLANLQELGSEDQEMDNAETDLLLKHKLEILGVPLHKKLLEIAERRNSRLNSLKFQIEFNEKRRATLQITRPVKEPEEDVLQAPFAPLTGEEEAQIASSLSSSNRRKVLVTHSNSNIEITGTILQCLRPRAWLNDEVINVYLELLKEREKREPKKFLKCHFLNTFFYKKLIGGRNGYDFKSIRRWTSEKKLGYLLFECDKIFVPIHKEVHWCLGIINKKEEKIQYLDSLGGFDNQAVKVLCRYFVDEVKDKCGKDIDVSSWKKEYVKDLPEQENGWDCGMFMIKYIDFYSRGLGLCFNQGHMPYFRLRTAKEILQLKAE